MHLYNVLCVSLPVSVIVKIETEHQYTIINYFPWPSNTKSSIKLMDSLQCHLNVGIFTDIYTRGWQLKREQSLARKVKARTIKERREKQLIEDTTCMTSMS